MKERKKKRKIEREKDRKKVGENERKGELARG